MSGLTRKLRNKLKIHESKWKWEHSCPKTLGYNKDSPKGEVCCSTGLTQEVREVSNTKSNLTPNGSRKGTANKAKSHQKKGNKDWSRSKW